MDTAGTRNVIFPTAVVNQDAPMATRESSVGKVRLKRDAFVQKHLNQYKKFTFVLFSERPTKISQPATDIFCFVLLY